MFNALMNAITDANMLIEYTENAKVEGNNQWAEKFKQQAIKRIKMLPELYSNTRQQFNMDIRLTNDDNIACALDYYVNAQIDLLNKKINIL